MTTRSYLSIGDVLSLLREEFPDVTISKIRFLESQGLVNPERSPSGYRKFYDHDVERLRWVLRQQREHFLPLKVIRDRLSTDGEDLGSAPADLEPRAQAVAVADAPAEAAGGANGSESPRDVDAPAALDEGRPGAEDPLEAAAVTSRPAAMGSAPNPTAASASVPSSGPSSGGPPSGSAPAEVPVPPVERRPSAAPRPANPAPATPGAPSEARATPESGGHGEVTPDPVPPAEPFELAAGPSGASLTLHELCAAGGLSASTVAALEGFGLIQSMDVGGTAYYDEEALTVSRLVLEFSRFGLEPRHLRLYRNTVDREVGLVEQVVTPQLRQRSPEARRRATEGSAELVRLGQALRAALLRRELRDLLGY
jgi:DNA-binding transcriptional MerR regulator